MNHRTVFTLSLLIASTFFVNGCATPYDIGTADSHITPGEAVKNITAMQNRSVAWGGMIVAAKNLPDKTELEAVSYPLDSGNRPDNTATPAGRFIVIQSGYLETADYAPGRLITVVGTVSETRAGTVGEAKYTYPVVTATKLRLWPRLSDERREPSFHFGVGVGISR
jgi:outer membrane lipoprotein